MRAIACAMIFMVVSVLGAPHHGAAQTSSLVSMAVGVAQDLGPEPAKARVRRLKAGADLDAYYWKPAPDGTWFSHVDWETGNLARYDLATGESRSLTNKGTWEDSEEFAEISAVSPDGKTIAFAWCCVPGYELRLIDADGSKERTLWTPDEGDEPYVVPAAWSPSGNELLVYLVAAYGAGEDGSSGTRTLVVSPETGTAEVAWTLDGMPDFTQYSPDGRYVVYSGGAWGPGSDSDLFIRDLKSGEESVLFDGNENVLFLGWSAAGDQVMFHSEIDGSPSIYALRVENGVRSGPPAVVRRDVPALEPAGGTNGRHFYGVTLERPGVHTMALEIPSGRVLQAPAAVVEPTAGPTSLGDWSPSGEYLAYVQYDSAAWQASGSIVLRSADGSNLREIPLPDLGGERPRTLMWTPSGNRIVVSSVGPSARRSVWVDLRSGEAAPIPGLGDEWIRNGRIAFSADERHAYLAGVSFDNSKVVKLDLESGQTETVFERPPVEGPWKNLAGIAISPDGETLAIAYNDAVCLMSIEGGEPRWVFEETRSPEDGGVFIMGYGVTFSPDGKYLVGVDGSTAVENRAVLAIPADGGEPVRLQTVPRMSRVSLHPDGKRIAFSAGENRAELWVMEFPE